MAARHGFLDPFAVMARLQRFSQPSEVAEPIELLRAGLAMHARGLINSRVIQNNLDWVWPFWVRRQFDPRDRSFMPRAFSLTHINLTHRNWTALGVPDGIEFPIVDPRGLVTPFLDGWSLDSWILSADGRRLLPPDVADAEQALDLARGLAVITRCRADGLGLDMTAEMEADGAALSLTYAGRSANGGWLVVGLRPYNPEGVSFLHDIALEDGRRGWNIDKQASLVTFDAPADHHQTSHYRHGDVFGRLPAGPEDTAVSCDAGMATAAAAFALAPGERRAVNVRVRLLPAPPPARPAVPWDAALEGRARLEVPDPRLAFLYEAAVRTLVLLAPDDVYAGPFTYRRFWYRDAVFIVHALLCAGLAGRARRAIDRFPRRQNALGFFHSQDGEWDSNGQVLWAYGLYCRLTGTAPPGAWQRPVYDGARWIVRKRLPGGTGEPHAGLLPPGFSAEHFGPNDYYYWDDFWGVAGLRAAAQLAQSFGDGDTAQSFRSEADRFLGDIEASLAHTARRLSTAAMPASPYRRMDAGAIGSLAAGYPLQLFDANDPRLRETANFLMRNCLVDGGFFQDIIHSGINAYLTLHLAEVLMRAGDARSGALVDRIARLASSTGQWPEAVHPHTGGGCMGDGQHGWAAAEWVAMVRNSFMQEEGNRLVLGRGLGMPWLAAGRRTAFGPTPTAFGTVEVELRPARDRLEVSWQARWRMPPAVVELNIPGWQSQQVEPDAGGAVLEPA
jgi:hypothetical protein